MDSRLGTIGPKSSRSARFAFPQCRIKASDPWVPFDVAAQVRESLVLQNVIHWIKSIYVENDSYGDSVSINVGHFKPINSRRFLNDAHEYVFSFHREGNVLWIG